MTRRKIFTIITFTILMLLIGRNSTFLPRFSFFLNTKNESAALKKQIQEVVRQQTGSYSVYFSNVDDGRLSFGINENFIHTAASVNKVPIVVTLYYLASQNKINLDEKITVQENDIQDYGTGSLRYEEPGRSYSLKTLAKLTLEQSDNTAAHILAQKIGTDNIHEVIENFGLTQTSMENNKTTLTDMHILFKKIYSGEIANKALTNELLDFLKDTDIEDRIPKLLPEDTVVYHKTGDAVGIIHDVGIVEQSNSAFFVGIMTSDIGNREEETKNAIAKIAKIIFDFNMNK